MGQPPCCQAQKPRIACSQPKSLPWGSQFALDDTDQFDNGIKSRDESDGGEEDWLARLPLSKQQAEEVKDFVAKVESDARQNVRNVAELLGLQSGRIPAINPGDGNPWQRRHIPLEHFLVSFSISLLSRDERICLTDRPIRGRPFFALGSPISNKSSARAQGHDASQKLSPRVRSPLSGDCIWVARSSA